MNRKTRQPDYFLDITEDVCPMTFVKVRLQIEKMTGNEVLEIRLKGAEPLKNVPDSVTELGHSVVSLDNENPASGVDKDGIYRLIVEIGANIR
jgi:TusA-related sulfurtransferase